MTHSHTGINSKYAEILARPDYAPWQSTPKPATSPALQHGPMTITSEVVTPEIAAQWITKQKRNRRLRQDVVIQYAREMTEGRWEIVPVCIAFGPDGLGVNGNHTLHAVVKSGVTITCMVARNVPDAAVAAMDVGLRRSVNDVAHFLNKPEATNAKIAIARALAWGLDDSHTRRSYSEVFEALTFYRPEIDFAVESRAITYPACISSVMVAAAAEAPQSERDEITRFVGILQSLETSCPEDRAASLLGKYILAHKQQMHSRAGRIEAYARAQNALRHFLDRNPIKWLKHNDAMYFWPRQFAPGDAP